LTSPRDDGENLLKRARAGCGDALGELFSRAGPRLLCIVRLRLGPALRPHVDSTDVVQATFLKALLGLQAFRGTGSPSFGAWLAGIAANEIRDVADHHARRKRDIRRTVPLDDAPEIRSLANAVRSETSRIALDERALLLEHALESLPDEHREVIIERSLEERTFPEIAKRMGRTPDACRMLYARAMAALTLRMESEGSPDTPVSRAPFTRRRMR
jgi:RNA polymerase sigma-70 factor (ECF subfamily)